MQFSAAGVSSLTCLGREINITSTERENTAVHKFKSMAGYRARKQTLPRSQ
jgi:hypothetical protein